MDTNDALALARELLDRHGRPDWDVRLDHARRRAGPQCGQQLGCGQVSGCASRCTENILGWIFAPQLGRGFRYSLAG